NHISVEGLYFPEKALDILKSRSVQELGTGNVPDPSDEADKQILPESTHEPLKEKERSGLKSFHWRRFAAAAIIIFSIVVAGPHIRTYINEPHIIYSMENYTDDPDYGTIYEIDYVITAEPTHEWIQNYIDTRVAAYVKQKELDIEIVKLVFYDNKKNLINRDEEQILADAYVIVDLY
ncbi:MAG: hypothetical protein LUC90_02750, partial [Lachnospiraceae bacterium]|nr:hypothetical protein [Lachnospiraceae bacterium]